MPPGPQGRAGQHNHNGLLAGAPDGHAPPPSTLAAQLVESINTTARSGSRPDETSELKRLFGIIEQIKNQPETLKTTEERIEHNHMLIYVCARVGLEGLQWDDDPFMDHARQRSEALKAINFLRVTIKETPAVLKYCTNSAAFLFRGEEPLWLWLLPRVLRLLGAGPCQPISRDIEKFCQFVITTSHRNVSLWDLQPVFVNYFQGNFSG